MPVTKATITKEIDIYRTAKLYIDQHGDQAALALPKESCPISARLFLPCPP